MGQHGWRADCQGDRARAVVPWIPGSENEPSNNRTWSEQGAMTIAPCSLAPSVLDMGRSSRVPRLVFKQAHHREFGNFTDAAARSVVQTMAIPGFGVRSPARALDVQATERCVDDARFDRAISHLAWSEHCGFDADVCLRGRHQHLWPSLRRSRRKRPFSTRWGVIGTEWTQRGREAAR
jgi:hypothetical protein